MPKAAKGPLYIRRSREELGRVQHGASLFKRTFQSLHFRVIFASLDTESYRFFSTAFISS